MSDNTGKKAVVTGLGLICLVGTAVAPAWESLLAGQSGISRISDFDVSKLAAQIAGRVPSDFDPSSYMPAKDIKKADVFIHYGVAAAEQALKDAQFDTSDETLLAHTGVFMGSGIGGLSLIEKTHKDYMQKEKKVSPFLFPAPLSI